MALNHGIRVEVISGGQSLPLYADPHEVHNPSSQTHQYYFQAVTGAQFEINVTLTKDFVMGCDYLQIGVNYGGNRWYGNYYRKRMWLLQRKDRVFPFGTIVNYDAESGGWRRMSVSFGSLDIEETSKSMVTSADIQNLGTISISVTRVALVKDSARVPAQPSKVPFKQISQVPGKTLGATVVSNAIRLVPGPLLEAEPGRDPCIYDRLPGPKGESMIFNLLYRSEETLQLLGCMPRMPNSKPEISGAASITTKRSTWKEDDASTLNPEEETGVLAVSRLVWRNLVGKLRSAGQQSHTPGT